MKRIFTLFSFVLLSAALFAQPNLPIDFEANIDYQISNFGGGELTVIPNPDASGINTSATVGQMIKFEDQVFGGSLMTLESPMDFDNNNTFKVKVWSPEAGRRLLLKVENLDNAGIFFEQEQATTTAGQWEELTYDFTNIDRNNSYQKIVLIFELGNLGDGTANSTYFVDDIRLIQEGEANELELPIDFEADIDYQIDNFGGGELSVIDNPDMSGINTSMRVGQMIKFEGEVFGGSTMTLNAPMDFETNNTFKVKVWSPAVGRRLLFKVENVSNGGIFFELEQETTTANAWEELTFDFSAINKAESYQKITLIFELGNLGDGTANSTYYIDDIQLVFEDSDVVKPDLPIGFEDGEVDYAIRDFNGTGSSIVADPTDGTNTVLQTVRGAGAEFFAGTVIADNGLDNPIPLTMDQSIMSIRVWSPVAGIPVRVKVENSADPTQSVETETMTMVAEEWAVMEFDFNNQVDGTAALNEDFTYDKIVIFYNFGTPGPDVGEQTFFSDDYTFGMITSNEVVDAAAAGISVFPNPVQDVLNIEIPADITGQVQASLFDMRGALLNVYEGIQNGTSISVADIAPGTYMLRLEGEERSYIQKVMINR